MTRARWPSAHSAYSGARQFVEAVSLDPPFRHFPDFRVVAVRRIAPSGGLGNGKHTRAEQAVGPAGDGTDRRAREPADRWINDRRVDRASGRRAASNDGQIGTSVRRAGALRDVECRNRPPKRLTENELSDFSRLWHGGCDDTNIEAQHVDRNHSPEVSANGTALRKRSDGCGMGAD